MRVRQMFATSAALTLLMAGSAAAQTAPPPPTPPPAPQAPPARPAPVMIPALPDLPSPLFDRVVVPPMTPMAPMAAMALDDARWALDSARFAMMDLPTPLAWSQTPPPGQYSFNMQSDTYISGKELLNARKYDEAIVRFDRVIAQKNSNADGALYWKAYAQFKLGKSDDALASISQLRRDHAQSRYLTDAKALEGDVRRMAGQPANPASMDDDEYKLLAMQGLMRTDPERTIPQIENMLTAPNSLRLKKNALYLLGLSTQPRARQILINYAKGAGNPDLQLEAIRYLVANREKNAASTKDLMEIYQSTQDVQVRMAVISALRSSGDQVSLIGIAQNGQNPMVLRQQALGSVSGTISPTELWTLYEKETNRELKLQIISAFANIQATDQLNRIARTEKDNEIRRSAVRGLGRMKTEKTGQMLVDLYGAEQDTDTRRVVISALASQNNAEALVAIARKETTLALKTDIVRRLSDLAPKSKVAADYLMEIIK